MEFLKNAYGTNRVVLMQYFMQTDNYFLNDSKAKKKYNFLKYQTIQND